MNKFNLGHKVNGGMVVGVLATNLYANIGNTFKLTDPHPWDDKYPNWRDKFIYYILFPEYQKVYTEEEFYQQYPSISKFIKDECRTEYYETYVTKARCLAMPQDALEFDIIPDTKMVQESLESYEKGDYCTTQELVDNLNNS